LRSGLAGGEGIGRGKKKDGGGEKGCSGDMRAIKEPKEFKERIGETYFGEARSL